MWMKDPANAYNPYPLRAPIETLRNCSLLRST